MKSKEFWKIVEESNSIAFRTKEALSDPDAIRSN